jgi:hypothetical protein
MAAAAVVDVIVTAIVIIILTVIIVATVNWCSSGHPAHSLVAMTVLTQFELNSGLLIFCSRNQLIVMRHVEITDVEIKKTKSEWELHYVAQASCVVIEHG